jgi:hypothetical protein
VVNELTPCQDYFAAGDMDDVQNKLDSVPSVLADLFCFRLTGIIFCALSLHITCILLRWEGPSCFYKSVACET